MNLVIVGAGSLSTPHLFNARELTSLAGVLRTTLVGRHDEKTHAVATAIRALNPAYQLEIANVADDLSQAFERADAIIIQARYGGYDARHHDEMFPLQFGIPGDEGLGPGGLANGWRSWPELASLLQRIVRVQPRAAVLFLTAPLGLLTRCARIAYPSLRWFAMCELPYVTLQEVCRQVGTDWATTHYDYAGINHLGWFDRLESNGADLIPLAARVRGNSPFPSGDVIGRLGAVPLRYLQLHYFPSEAIAAQRARPSRAKLLLDAVRPGLAAYGGGDVAAIAAALAWRDAPWYYHAVAPYVATLMGKPASAPFFITTENRDYITELAPDDVIEIPHRAEVGRLVRIRRARTLSKPLLDALKLFVEFERAAAPAIAERNLKGLSRAVAAHPWVHGADARAITDRIVSPVTAGDRLIQR